MITASEVECIRSELEHLSCPMNAGGFWIPKRASKVVNGKTLTAQSRMNRGRSGKMYTTSWLIDGKRVSKADVVPVILAQ